MFKGKYAITRIVATVVELGARNETRNGTCTSKFPSQTYISPVSEIGPMEAKRKEDNPLQYIPLHLLEFLCAR